MKCFQCKKKIEGDGVLISVDGDFVCDDNCKKEFEEQKDDFFNRIMNEELFKKWLTGENV